MTETASTARIITVEFEYNGCDADDSWVERRLADEFSVSDIRVIAIRPTETTITTPAIRYPSIYAGA